MRDTAIRNVHPEVVSIYDEKQAWDQDGNVVVLDEEKIAAEVARLKAEYEAKEYQRNRASEYPSFADQFDLLYHGGYDVWKAKIDEIKNKYPKPESM